MLRNAARRAIGRMGGASPSLAVRGNNDVNAAASWTTTTSTLGNHLGSATAVRWFAKRAVKPRVGGRVVVGGEKSKALQPIALAWTEVLDARTGKTYWWNKTTGETTALGEPKPDAFKLAPVNRGNYLTRPFDARGQPTVGLAMGQMFIFGIGGALGITFVSFLVRGMTGMEPHDPSVRAEFDSRRRASAA